MSKINDSFAMRRNLQAGMPVALPLANPTPAPQVVPAAPKSPTVVPAAPKPPAFLTQAPQVVPAAPKPPAFLSPQTGAPMPVVPQPTPVVGPNPLQQGMSFVPPDARPASLRNVAPAAIPAEKPLITSMEPTSPAAIAAGALGVGAAGALALRTGAGTPVAPAPGVGAVPTSEYYNARAAREIAARSAANAAEEAADQPKPAPKPSSAQTAGAAAKAADDAAVAESRAAAKAAAEARNGGNPITPKTTSPASMRASKIRLGTPPPLVGPITETLPKYNSPTVSEGKPFTPQQAYETKVRASIAQHAEARASASAAGRGPVPTGEPKTLGRPGTAPQAPSAAVLNTRAAIDAVNGNPAPKPIPAPVAPAPVAPAPVAPAPAEQISSLADRMKSPQGAAPSRLSNFWSGAKGFAGKGLRLGGNLISPAIETYKAAQDFVTGGLTDIEKAARASQAVGTMATTTVGAGLGSRFAGWPGAVVGGVAGAVAPEYTANMSNELLGTDIQLPSQIAEANKVDAARDASFAAKTPEEQALRDSLAARAQERGVPKWVIDNMVKNGAMPSGSDGVLGNIDALRASAAAGTPPIAATPAAAAKPYPLADAWGPQPRPANPNTADRVVAGSKQSERLIQMANERGGYNFGVYDFNKAPVDTEARFSRLRDGTGTSGGLLQGNTSEPGITNLGSYGGDSNIYATASKPGGRLNQFFGVGAQSRGDSSAPVDEQARARNAISKLAADGNPQAMQAETTMRVADANTRVNAAKAAMEAGAKAATANDKQVQKSAENLNKSVDAMYADLPEEERTAKQGALKDFVAITPPDVLQEVAGVRSYGELETLKPMEQNNALRIMQKMMELRDSQNESSDTPVFGGGQTQRALRLPTDGLRDAAWNDVWGTEGNLSPTSYARRILPGWGGDIGQVQQMEDGLVVPWSRMVGTDNEKVNIMNRLREFTTRNKNKKKE